jgi:tetratricopeptide (TPR) repeat protein
LSVEIDPAAARDAIVILLVNSSSALYQAGIIDQDQAIQDYFTVSKIVDSQLAKNSSNKRWLRTKDDIDGMVLDEGLLTCEALNTHYEPKFEANQNNLEFLKKMIDFYYTSGCDRSDMYVMASEKLYEIEPSPEAAYNLAHLLVIKNEYDRAISYYQEAVNADVDAETKADYYYELAQVVRLNGDPCKSIDYARESVKNNPNMGKTYILQGDLYIESRESLGEEFEVRTAFWAAADKYIKAKNMDPTVSDEANKRLNDYAVQYPDGEACFFRSLQEGDSYQVKGCINEYTTVRPRSE